MAETVAVKPSKPGVPFVEDKALKTIKVEGPFTLREIHSPQGTEWVVVCGKNQDQGISFGSDRNLPRKFVELMLS